VKLLRALQEGEVDPVGSKRPVKVDVRIVAATNRDLGAMVREGSFREDLYYRLNVFPVTVPALRDRSGDIAPLSRHFITRFAAEEHKQVAGLTQEAADLLQRFSWPGNVRQLENTIFRAVVLCDGALLDVCDFPQIAAAMGIETATRQTTAAGQASEAEPVQAPVSTYGLNVTDAAGNIRKFVEMESEIIRMAIARYNGHMSEVARRLGIGRSTLYRKLKEFGLEGDVAAEEEDESVIRKVG
jgi:DNA-binding NtrC family response regulator